MGQLNHLNELNLTKSHCVFRNNEKVKNGNFISLYETQLEAALLGHTHVYNGEM